MRRGRPAPVRPAAPLASEVVAHALGEEQGRLYLHLEEEILRALEVDVVLLGQARLRVYLEHWRALRRAARRRLEGGTDGRRNGRVAG